jgi:hypothetical protein
MFLDVCYKCVYLDVAYGSHICVASVLSGCYVCLQWFSSVFQVLFASVSEACFKCFICLQTNVVYISSGRFKNRLGVAHVAMSPAYCSC